MKKKHRSLSAVCLTALLVCLLPVNTMFAAAESTEPAQDAPGGSSAIVSEKQEEMGSEQKEMGSEQKEAVVEESEETASEEAGADTEDREVTDGAAEGAGSNIEETQETDVAESRVFSDNNIMAETSASPVIEIKLEGTDYAKALGGTIDYNKYIGNCDQRFSISVSGTDSAVTLYYYLANNGQQESETAMQLQDKWSQVLASYHNEILLNMDAKFVLYVKAEVDGQSYYARTDGVVVDTVAPQIIGVADGGTYQAGTTFTVQDDNLDSVTINDEIVTPSSDGSYRVKAKSNSTSCVIKAKDKADHETTVSITVEGDEADDSDGNNDTNVISKNGTYFLTAGTAYRLGGGKWKLAGDSVVYQGGRTFYVASDGEYTFELKD